MLNNEIIWAIARQHTTEYQKELSQYQIKKYYGRFNYTQAKIRNSQLSFKQEFDDGTYDTEVKYTPIISYYTCTAIVDHTNKVFYEVGKYSRTTSKQMTQIYNRFYRDYQRVLI